MACHLKIYTDLDPDPTFQFDPNPQHCHYEVYYWVTGVVMQKVQDDGRHHPNGEPQPRRSRRRLRHQVQHGEWRPRSRPFHRQNLRAHPEPRKISHLSGADLRLRKGETNAVRFPFFPIIFDVEIAKKCGFWPNMC